MCTLIIDQSNQNQNKREILKIIVRSGPGGPEPLRKKLTEDKRENRLPQNLIFIHARLKQNMLG
jgi:hypothetical protein